MLPRPSSDFISRCRVTLSLDLFSLIIMLPCLAPLILHVRCAANVPRSWNRQERLGAPRSVQQCPGTPRSALELSGIPGSAQERPAAPSSAQQRPREPGSAQESPGAPRSAKERPRASKSSRSALERPSFEERPGAPRSGRESPGAPRRVGRRVGRNSRPVKTKSRFRSPWRGSSDLFWELCGSILCSKN